MNLPHHLNGPFQVKTFLCHLSEQLFCFHFILVQYESIANVVSVFHTCKLWDSSWTHLWVERGEGRNWRCSCQSLSAQTGIFNWLVAICQTEAGDREGLPSRLQSWVLPTEQPHSQTVWNQARPGNETTNWSSEAVSKYIENSWPVEKSTQTPNANYNPMRAGSCYLPLRRGWWWALHVVWEWGTLGNRGSCKSRMNRSPLLPWRRQSLVSAQMVPTPAWNPVQWRKIEHEYHWDFCEGEILQLLQLETLHSEQQRPLNGCCPSAVHWCKIWHR